MFEHYFKNGIRILRRYIGENKKDPVNEGEHQNIEFEIGNRIVSLCTRQEHDGWQGTSMEVMTKDRSKTLLENHNASAIDVAEALGEAWKTFIPEPNHWPVGFFRTEKDMSSSRNKLEGELDSGRVINAEFNIPLVELPLVMTAGWRWRYGKQFKVLYACGECHSRDLQVSAWLKMNTGEAAGGDPPTDDCFCTKCDDETWVEEHEVPLEEL